MTVRVSQRHCQQISHLSLWVWNPPPSATPLKKSREQKQFLKVRFVQVSKCWCCLHLISTVARYGEIEEAECKLRRRASRKVTRRWTCQLVLSANQWSRSRKETSQDPCPWSSVSFFVSWLFLSECLRREVPAYTERSGTFEWGDHNGVQFSLWPPNEAPMTQWALNLTQHTVVWGSRVCVCVLSVWRAAAQGLAKQMSHTPLSVPPAKKYTKKICWMLFFVCRAWAKDEGEWTAMANSDKKAINVTPV